MNYNYNSLSAVSHSFHPCQKFLSLFSNTPNTSRMIVNTFGPLADGMQGHRIKFIEFPSDPTFSHASHRVILKQQI